MKKLEQFDSTYFRGKSLFEDDGTQNWLVFQPKKDILKRWLVLVVIDRFITLITSNLKDCDEKINFIKASNHIIVPKLDYYGTKTRVEFN